VCVFGGTLFVDNCIGACFVFVVGGCWITAFVLSCIGASDDGDTMLREVDAVVAEVRVLLLLLRLLLLPLFLLLLSFLD